MAETIHETPRRIIGIDPGPERSAAVALDERGIPVWGGVDDNAILLGKLKVVPPNVVIAIERVVCYGMPVGSSVLDMCVWIGRFIEAAQCPGRTIHQIPQSQVRSALCHSSRAKDSNIRQALIDRYGGEQAIGKKAAPGPLHGITGHMWSALAVAVTAREGDNTSEYLKETRL